MKQLLSLCVLAMLALLVLRCSSAKTPLSYEIDQNLWIQQDKDAVLYEFDQAFQQQSTVTEDDLHAFYSTQRTPVVSYPFIMILDKMIDQTTPSMEKLASDLGAQTMDGARVPRSDNFGDGLNDLNYAQTMVFPDRNLILMESPNATGGRTINIRQAMVFDDDRLIAIQFAYDRDQHGRLLKDFYRLLETLNY